MSLVGILKKIVFPFFLLLICGIGIYVRVQMIHHDLWLDELTSAWVVKNNFSMIFERCWINNLSPLYYIFVYISKVLFGFSESSLRIPSIIGGILTIPAIYILTYRLSRNHMIAAFASFLSSLDYTLIFYSYEVRPYSLIQFFTLIQLYFFLDILYKEPKVYCGIFLGFLSGIIILLHYTAGTIFIVETFIASVYFLRKRNLSKAKLKALLTCILLLSIFSIPVLKHIIYLFKNRDILGMWIPSKDLSSVFTIHYHLIKYILFPVVVTIFIGYVKRNSKDENILLKDKTFELFFLFSWYFIPILFQLALAKASIVNIYYPRYLLWILPAPIIASAILISVFRTKRAKIAFIFTLLIVTQFLSRSGSLPHLVKGDFRNTIGSQIVDAKFGWKEAVTKINNSGIVPKKVYIAPGLVEKKWLKNHENESRLLNEYLISPVNSMYKLDKIYLDRTTPIASIADISDLTSDFFLVGWISEKVEKYFECPIKMSPEGARMKIFYVKAKQNCRVKKE